MYGPSNTNLAYDLSLFDVDENAEKRAKERAEKAKIQANERASASKSGNTLKAIFLAATAAIILFAILTSKVELSELANQINKTQSEYDEAVSENIRLQAMLDNNVTLSKVEEYATGTLGMQKVQSTQVQHIAVNTEKMTEIADAGTDNIFVAVGQWFGEIMEYLGF